MPVEKSAGAVIFRKDKFLEKKIKKFIVFSCIILGFLILIDIKK
jgi:hypothetical protein